MIRYFSEGEEQTINKYMEKMLILSHQGNVNKNFCEMPFHPGQNDCQQESI